MDTWALLGKFVDASLAPQGIIGKLIGRVLNILAMDRAINKLPTSSHERCPLKYQMPVTVASYFEELFTNQGWKLFCSSVPMSPRELLHQDALAPFKESFDGAYLHFSHYAKAKDGTPLKNSYA